MMKDLAIPGELDMMNTTNARILFLRNTKGAITRERYNAIEQLETWLQYQRY